MKPPKSRQHLPINLTVKIVFSFSIILPNLLIVRFKDHPLGSGWEVVVGRRVFWVLVDYYGKREILEKKRFELS